MRICSFSFLSEHFRMSFAARFDGSARRLGLAASMFLVTGMAHAAPYPAALLPPNSTAQAWGVSARIDTTGHGCIVQATIDQTRFITQMPQMIAAGIFSTRLTSDLIQQTPHYLMNVLQTDISPGFVHALFMQAGAPARCRFTWDYVAPGPSGGLVSHPMVSFEFTRPAHDRINWPQIRFGDMIASEDAVRTDPLFDAQVNEETLDITIALAHDDAGSP
ncbi:hypothetical protein GHA01_02670 [Novacetimonas hansenii]|uniref:Lipid/polyisoprenoid-binding YceI-like domain-containing protein n=3 Tax=Novacetimonas hansenii TaxID=436 RepID=A0ABQ0SB55_NOVHA|nr:hypothetical protein GXY_02396 [Novacetimonas hansenii ATCC 23769]GAN83744.1 hypothetical protein Gaha_0102_004 [Novacetimonas hansenii JCM 7643]GEC62418.1 hypothetical protein GHA01_02670 [Novacetimonas hansenii]